VSGDAAPLSPGERALDRLLATIAPLLDEPIWAFCPTPAGGLPAGLRPLMVFHEAEGGTLVVEAEAARRAGLVVAWLGRRLTLAVHSDLAVVGFLAAVSSALARAGIACNAVAALRHDHLFVAPEDAERALLVLRDIEHRARTGTGAPPPVLYSVRVTLAAADQAEWLAWMEGEHLPAVMATGGFVRCEIAREVEPVPPEGMVTFVMEYLATSEEAYDRYRTSHAPGLQQASTTRFGGRFNATRSLRVLRPSQP
jgi:hypothetical protein